MRTGRIACPPLLSGPRFWSGHALRARGRRALRRLALLPGLDRHLRRLRRGGRLRRAEAAAQRVHQIDDLGLRLFEERAHDLFAFDLLLNEAADALLHLVAIGL